MKWRRYLYPSAWRRRYGDEFAALDAQIHRRDYGRRPGMAPAGGGTAVLSRRNPVVGTLVVSTAATLVDVLDAMLTALSYGVPIAVLPWYATRLGDTCELPRLAAIRSCPLPLLVSRDASATAFSSTCFAGRTWMTEPSRPAGRSFVIASERGRK